MPVNFNTVLDGTPSTVYVATTELIPYGFEFAPNLLPGEFVANPSYTLTNLTLNTSVTALDNPVVAVNSTSIVIQEVRGSELLVDHVYRLTVSADVQGIVTNKRLTISVLIQVPY